MQTWQRYRLGKGIYDQAKYTLKAMQKLLVGVGYLTKKTVRLTKWQRTVVRLKWYLRRKDMESLQGNLDSVKQTLIVFTTIVQLKQIEGMGVIPTEKKKAV